MYTESEIARSGGAPVERPLVVFLGALGVVVGRVVEHGKVRLRQHVRLVYRQHLGIQGLGLAYVAQNRHLVWGLGFGV